MTRDPSYNRDNYYNKTELKELGFTESMIGRLLGGWDVERQNPIYKSAPNVKLWGKERVDGVMETAEFAEARAKADKRQASARKAVETKRAKTDEALAKSIGGIVVDELKGLTYENILELGVEHYNRLK